MKIEGAVLRAALECAAKPTKKDPHRWTTCVRVAPLGDEKCLVEATDGRVMMRLVLEHECEAEAFIRHETLKRIKDSDEVEITDGMLEVEEAALRHDFLPLDTLPDKDGKPMRVWPDFGHVIPRGTRTPAPAVAFGPNPLTKVLRSVKHLGALALRFEIGGPTEAAKVTARCLYGVATYIVMPVELVEDE